MNKSVLLFSGGMDSVMYAYLLHPDVLLRVNMHESYEERERSATEVVVELMGWENIYVEDNETFNFSAMERSDYIIPNRNIYLIAKASEYGEIIWLSSVNGDRSLDKDEEFYADMEKLLNHVWDEQHWTKKRTIQVTAPFKPNTKTQLLKIYLENGGPIDSILASYSCYKGEEKPCGICKPCMRKAVALVNNGIDITGYFQNSPLTAIQEVLPLAMAGKYRGQEDKDIINAANILAQQEPQ
ncbi:MAG: 7-cyano-7-deazaguanine synthase [Candidatus Parvarchaeum sp.]